MEAAWDARGDAVNDELSAAWRALAAEEVRRRAREVPGELRGYLTVVPETRWVKHPVFGPLLRGGAARPLRRPRGRPAGHPGGRHVTGPPDGVATLGLAPAYAGVALATIGREFPGDAWHTWRAPDDAPPRPRERTPVFWGSYDWHSSVEMHWVLVRLLRLAPGAFAASEARAALEARFEAAPLAREAAFIADPDNRNRERPYGWGWALALAPSSRRSTTRTGGGGAPASGLSSRRSRPTSWPGSRERPIRSATGCTPTAPSGSGSPCRTPRPGPPGATAASATRSWPRPTAGSTTTSTRREPGSRRASTSSRRRWWRRS